MTAGALRHDLRRGASLMLAAMFLFTVMGAMVKALGPRVPFPELMFFRTALAMPVVAAIVFRRRDWGLLRTRRFGGHFLRALTGMGAMTSTFYALTVLPLAEQTALGYTTPLFVILLSVPMLGEAVGADRWAAVLVGLAGVVVIALGQGAFLGHGVAVAGTMSAVAAGMFSGVTTMLVRQLSSTEASATIVMWQSMLMTAFGAIALPFVWVAPAGWDLALLLLIGLTGGIGQLLLTEAYASAQVAALGPYFYSSILWSVGLGWLIWGEAPTVWTLAGAGLIVAAGLWILRRELRRRRAA